MHDPLSKDHFHVDIVADGKKERRLIVEYWEEDRAEPAPTPDPIVFRDGSCLWADGAGILHLDPAPEPEPVAEGVVWAIDNASETCVNRQRITVQMSGANDIRLGQTVTLTPVEPQEPELKPCPFCGGDAAHTPDAHSPGVFVECGTCTAKVYGNTKSRGTDNWNRRAE